MLGLLLLTMMPNNFQRPAFACANYCETPTMAKFRQEVTGSSKREEKKSVICITFP